MQAVRYSTHAGVVVRFTADGDRAVPLAGYHGHGVLTVPLGFPEPDALRENAAGSHAAPGVLEEPERANCEPECDGLPAGRHHPSCSQSHEMSDAY